MIYIYIPKLYIYIYIYIDSKSMLLVSPIPLRVISKTVIFQNIQATFSLFEDFLRFLQKQRIKRSQTNSKNIKTSQRNLFGRFCCIRSGIPKMCSVPYIIVPVPNCLAVFPFLFLFREFQFSTTSRPPVFYHCSPRRGLHFSKSFVSSATFANSNPKRASPNRRRN